MQLPEYDKLNAKVLADVVNIHSDVQKDERPVNFNRFAGELFDETSPKYFDWCFLAAMALVAAERTYEANLAEAITQATVEVFPEFEPLIPEPSKYDKAKEFLTNLLSRGTPSVPASAGENAKPIGS